MGMGRAHDAITRRVTSQATAATTDTLFPPSRAVSGLSSMRSRMSCVGGNMSYSLEDPVEEDVDVTSSTTVDVTSSTATRAQFGDHSEEDDMVTRASMRSSATRFVLGMSMRSEPTKAVSDHSVQSFHTVHVNSGQSHEPEQAPEPEESGSEQLQAYAECKPPSKVFRICHGGL